MGCLRLTYSAEESPLRVSKDEEKVPENWQVWVNEKPAKKVKEAGVQPSGGNNYQAMLDAALQNPEIARFLAMAPNTQFDIDPSLPSHVAPKTVPINGDKTIPGPARITLGPVAFESPEQLFTILGHELIHATHFESGSYARWNSEYGFNSNGVRYAHYISEAYAYKWSAPYVNQFGLGGRIGGFDTYNKYLRGIPAGYNFPK